MKQRWTAPALAAAVGLTLALSACGGDAKSGSGDAAEKNALTVWLMNGSVPDPIVKSVNADLAKQHPGATVTVEVQEWNGIQDKLTTALAGNNPPDVIEMGNTQNAKFSQSGALLDLDADKAKLGIDGWSKGMASSGLWDGKTYGAPLLAANRVVIYRTDLFDKAGVAVPKTFDEWVAATKKLNQANAATKDFQGIYLPGQSWYVYAGLLWDAGGDLAVKDGNAWKGGLDTPAAAEAIGKYKRAAVAVEGTQGRRRGHPAAVRGLRRGQRRADDRPALGDGLGDRGEQEARGQGRGLPDPQQQR